MSRLGESPDVMRDLAGNVQPLFLVDRAFLSRALARAFGGLPLIDVLICYATCLDRLCASTLEELGGLNFLCSFLASQRTCTCCVD